MQKNIVFYHIDAEITWMNMKSRKAYVCLKYSVTVTDITISQSREALKISMNIDVLTKHRCLSNSITSEIISLTFLSFVCHPAVNVTLKCKAYFKHKYY